ncbi:hypothetical protein GCM10020221_31780 [Streptomyces thioluteus]|uniref:Penicillin-binding protein transpeptidase domain-containing protein n=2 Tax=Streptomyces thioluteus TaxID=66431 RepID=A0ABN3X0C8_STRTU
MTWPAMTDCGGRRFPEAGEVHNDSPSLVGPFTMPEAMAQSVNTYFARLEADTGLCDVAAVAGRLGITSRADGSPLQVVPSLTLGSNDLTPLDVADAYAAFAAHGTYCSPVAITSVTTSDGRDLAVPRTRCRRAMSAGTADAVTGMLRDVVEDGTGRPAALTHRDSAGKTGTTESSKQVWFAAYTPELSGAVVVGDPRPPPRPRRPERGRHGRGARVRRIPGRARLARRRRGRTRRGAGGQAGVRPQASLAVTAAAIVGVRAARVRVWLAEGPHPYRSASPGVTMGDADERAEKARQIRDKAEQLNERAQHTDDPRERERLQERARRLRERGDRKSEAEGTRGQPRPM